MLVENRSCDLWKKSVNRVCFKALLSLCKAKSPQRPKGLPSSGVIQILDKFSSADYCVGDSKNIAVNYNSFTANAGASYSYDDNRKNCQLTLSVKCVSR